MSLFKIHPAIGVARVGDSERDFYLAPEQPGALPIACDGQGRALVKDGALQRVERFRDAAGRLLRQAARFRVFAYDGPDDAGREIKVGDTFAFELETSVTGQQQVEGTVTDIAWTVHLANKKASWYRFHETAGMHGYSPTHPLRNPDVNTPDGRRRLIIDPGPQTVSYTPSQERRKAFARGENPGCPQTFPPAGLAPYEIDTLGEAMVNEQEDHLRLIVLGGYGRAGSSTTPVITQYANNDGWYDDLSDGPVTARIRYKWVEKYTDDKGKKRQKTHQGEAEVDVPAWVVVGYPRYAPEIVDMITMDEAMYDVFVRHFAYAPSLFGMAPFDAAHRRPTTASEWAVWRAEARFNEAYYPKFYEEIWPILKRPNAYGSVFVFDFFEGSDPHNTGTGGELDEAALSVPPQDGHDPQAQHRQFIYGILRKAGEENQRESGVLSRRTPGYEPRAMPELCGHNPLSNTAPQKFLRLTDTQLFLLKQWAAGKFVNECREWGEDDPHCKDPFVAPPATGAGLDRGVLGNVVGGAFCPGAELTWIMLNPALYDAPYRLRHAAYIPGGLSLPAAAEGSDAADLASGLEPGDLTKYLALPWQADFTQCTEQDVNITYRDWNDLYLDTTGDPAQQQIAYNVPWWPAHRPMVVSTPQQEQVYWASGIPPNNAGGLRMVTGWKDLGFVKKLDPGNGVGEGFYLVERNEKALGPLVKPGGLLQGNTKTSERSG